MNSQEETFVVTAAWIHDNSTPAGAWRARQLRLLGVEWPPAAGWIERVSGMSIAVSSRQQFEQDGKGCTDAQRAESELDGLRRHVATLARENSDLRTRMDALESAFRQRAFSAV